jgi:hypothetical protein
MLTRPKARSRDTIPPTNAELILPVDDRMPGKMSAPKAANGTKRRNEFKNRGKRILFKNVRGSIRGTNVTTPISRTNSHKLSIMRFPPQEKLWHL